MKIDDIRLSNQYFLDERTIESTFDSIGLVDYKTDENIVN
jgi:hypothetical protein